jgi:hypothetical protein
MVGDARLCLNTSATWALCFTMLLCDLLRQKESLMSCVALKLDFGSFGQSNA